MTELKALVIEQQQDVNRRFDELVSALRPGKPAPRGKSSRDQTAYY